MISKPYFLLSSSNNIGCGSSHILAIAVIASAVQILSIYCSSPGSPPPSPPSSFRKEDDDDDKETYFGWWGNDILFLPFYLSTIGFGLSLVVDPQRRKRMGFMGVFHTTTNSLFILLVRVVVPYYFNSRNHQKRSSIPHHLLDLTTAILSVASGLSSLGMVWMIPAASKRFQRIFAIFTINTLVLVLVEQVAKILIPAIAVGFHSSVDHHNNTNNNSITSTDRYHHSHHNGILTTTRTSLFLFQTLPCTILYVVLVFLPNLINHFDTWSTFSLALFHRRLKAAPNVVICSLPPAPAPAPDGSPHEGENPMRFRKQASQKKRHRSSCWTTPPTKRVFWRAFRKADIIQQIYPITIHSNTNPPTSNDDEDDYETYYCFQQQQQQPEQLIPPYRRKGSIFQMENEHPMIQAKHVLWPVMSTLEFAVQFKVVQMIWNNDDGAGGGGGSQHPNDDYSSCDPRYDHRHYCSSSTADHRYYRGLQLSTIYCNPSFWLTMTLKGKISTSTCQLLFVVTFLELIFQHVRFLDTDQINTAIVAFLLGIDFGCYALLNSEPKPVSKASVEKDKKCINDTSNTIEEEEEEKKNKKNEI